MLGELELDRPSGLSLDDRRPIAQDARYRQIAHFDRRQIASAKLTVDRKVEESKLSEIRGNLQSGSYSQTSFGFNGSF